MLDAIVLSALCAAFTDPGFHLSKERQESICNILPHVIEEAHRNNLDPFLLMGLITVESNWKSDAVSSAPACGLTQVMPKYTGGRATAGKKYTCAQLKDPETAVSVGSRVLSWWIYKYGRGKVPTGLCGYYAGYRCKPDLLPSGVSYYKKVLHRKNKILRSYSEKLNASNSHSSVVD